MNRSDFIPRSSKLKGSKGYYHVLLKGINQSNVFENNQNKTFLLIQRNR